MDWNEKLVEFIMQQQGHNTDKEWQEAYFEAYGTEAQNTLRTARSQR